MPTIPEDVEGGNVEENQIVVGKLPKLVLQVPGPAVGLANPGIAISDGKHGHGIQAASAGQRPPIESVQKTGVFEHPLHSSLASFGQVFNNPVQQ